MSRAPIIDTAVPVSDREEFIRENAVALVTTLEAKLVKRKSEVKRLQRAVENMRAHMKAQRFQIEVLQAQIAARGMK